MFTKNEILAYDKGYRIDENGNCFNLKNPDKFLNHNREDQFLF